MYWFVTGDLTERLPLNDCLEVDRYMDQILLAIVLCWIFSWHTKKLCWIKSFQV